MKKGILFVFVLSVLGLFLLSCQSHPGASYTITWVNWDGTVLEVDNNVASGVTPTYDGVVPSRPSDLSYNYTFSGWNPSVSTVSADATYMATFEASWIIPHYNVNWYDENGLLLATTYVAENTIPSYPYSGLADSAQWDYTFLGWSDTHNGAVVNIGLVNANSNYYAVSSQVLRNYSITWWDENEQVIIVDNLDYGQLAQNSYTGPQDDLEWDYTFLGWSLTPDGEVITIPSVSAEANYYAVVQKIKIQYPISWYDENGVFLETTLVDYGEIPTSTYDGPLDSVQWDYYVAGWASIPGSTMYSLIPVVGPASYYAFIGVNPQKYFVSWYDEFDNLIEDTIVLYGVTPSSSYLGATDDAQWDYTFLGWSDISGGSVLGSLPIVEGAASYYAISSKTLKSYMVKWFDELGNVLTSNTWFYGDLPTNPYTGPADTAQWDYTLIGWSTFSGGLIDELDIVVGDVAYFAIVTQVLQTLEITWYDENQVLLGYTYILYGDAPTHPYTGLPNTIQYTYTFKGWSTTPGGIANLVLPNTYVNSIFYAVSIQYLAEYSVSWVDYNGLDLAVVTYFYGDTPSYSYVLPPDTAQFTYTFLGWSESPQGSVLTSLPMVSGDIIYYAIVLVTPVV
ncbi:MAG: hypothetical protein LBV55_01745 [Acholeplasmatales bacterium]|jgi:uncharacterized protein YcfL|nr:hypothetical protein [Acholeplasmatales bacterium]